MGLAFLLGVADARAQTIADFLAQPGDGATVLAKVDGVEVRRAELVGLLTNMPQQVQQMPMMAIYPLALERLIDTKLVASAARKENLQADDEVKRRVRDAEERALHEVYVRRALDQKITDAALRDRYGKFLQANPPQEEVRARHILVTTEADARTALAELRRGGDFAQVARQRSIDGSAKDGGDLGFFTRGDMVAEFADAAFALKPGEVSREPVKSQFGWHLIKLEARRQQPTPSFEDTRGQLRTEMSQEAMDEVVEELRVKAAIERFGLDGTPLSR
jgi:peptidyl-prolyl cis-trans isomerase C